MYPISYSLSAVPYAMSFIALFCLCLAVMSLLYLRDTEEDTWLVRRYLQSRLRREPLAGLLKALGLKPAHYVRKAPVPLLRQQLRTCHSCPVRSHCARMLAAGRGGETELKFCPNLTSIRHRPVVSQTT